MRNHGETELTHFVGKIVSGEGGRWVLVEKVDVRDCGPDDGRTGMPILCGPAVDQYYYQRDGDTHVYESAVYADSAMVAWWDVPADVEKALRAFAAAKEGK